MFIQAVVSVLPLLLLIMLGFHTAKLPWYGRTGMNFLSKLCIDVVIPIYLFYTVVKTYSHPRELLELARNVQYPFIIILSGMALGAVMARLLAVKPPQRGVFINAVSLSNTVVMGMPVIASLFGDEVLPVGMIFYAANTIVYWTLGVWILKRDVGSREKVGIVKTLRGVFLTKPMIGFLLGIAWVLTALPLPVFLMRPLSMIGISVTPLAMMFVGNVIRHSDFCSISHLRELIIVIAYRLVAVPLFTGAICMFLPVEPIMKQVFFILPNMPAMAQLPIMSKEVGSDYELASMTTALTTVLSMAAVPVYVTVMSASGFLG